MHCGILPRVVSVLSSISFNSHVDKMSVVVLDVHVFCMMQYSTCHCVLQS